MQRQDRPQSRGRVWGLAAPPDASGERLYVLVDRDCSEARPEDSVYEDPALAPAWAATAERFGRVLIPLPGTGTVGAES